MDCTALIAVAVALKLSEMESTFEAWLAVLTVLMAAWLLSTFTSLFSH